MSAANPYYSTATDFGTPLVSFDMNMATVPGMSEASYSKQLSKALAYWQAVAATANQANVLTANQSDVETDLTGFTPNNGATLTRDTTQHHTGVASLKVVCPAPPSPGAAHFLGAYVPRPVATFTPGEQVTATVWMMGAAGGEAVRMLVWSDTPNMDLGNPQTFVLSTSWQPYSVTARLPFQPAAGNYGILLDTGPSPLGMTWYADTLSLGGSGLQPDQAFLASLAVPWLTARLAYVQSPTQQSRNPVIPV